MGAVEREVYGKVGIHRPYFGQFPHDAQSDDVVREFDSQHGQLHAFAQEMRIPFALIDRMYSIEPVDMVVLSEDELTYYGLNRVDPAFEEIEIMKQSRWFMITPTEYRRRLRSSEHWCDAALAIDDWVRCYNAALLGLSIEQYEDRRFEFSIQMDEGWPEDRKRECYVAVMIQGKREC
jgi:hypothetical protein